MISCVNTTPEHVQAVAARMRQDDIDELLASAFASAAEGLEQSVRASVVAMTVFIDGEPAAIVGFAVPELIGNVSVPWMLTTDVVDKHPAAFARASRRALPLLRAGFAKLENYVDARHTRCIAWLRWLGFDLGEPTPFPPLGMPFRRFSMKGNI